MFKCEEGNATSGICLRPRRCKMYFCGMVAAEVDPEVDGVVKLKLAS